MESTDTLADDLGRLLHGAVSELRRLSGGASRETWSFRLDGHPLILQRQRPGGDPSRSMADETAAVRAAGDAGLPVPAIVLDATGATCPSGFRRSSSSTSPARASPASSFATTSTPTSGRAWPSECGRILAGIHRMPADVDRHRPGAGPARCLAGDDGLLRHRPPGLRARPSGGWRSIDPRRRRAPPAVVHGDFRTGNLLVTPDGVTAVLDWEIVHLGDPIEDLGWFCVRAWRFGADDNPAGGFGTREQLWAGYEAGGGGAVDPDVARWWEIYGTLRWGVICLMQAAAHRLGLQPLGGAGRRSAGAPARTSTTCSRCSPPTATRHHRHRSTPSPSQAARRQQSSSRPSASGSRATSATATEGPRALPRPRRRRTCSR